MTCPECGAESESVWNEDVCSSICTQCGTLSDPSQYLLESHTEQPDISARQYQTWLTSSAATLKSIRSRNGWNLAGQGREARDRKNAIAMSTFITSVLTRLNSPGLSPRAETIFTQAMAAGKYRWGRKAKLAAGASIAIALREAHKSDSLRDIAFLLDDSPVSLSRSFLAVVSLLQLELASTDPAVHLPILQAHLQSLLHPQTLSASSQLPADLVATLTPLSLQSVVRTSVSLSGLISRHIPPLPITQLPTAPTACALFILGLEAETRNPLPHMGELAHALASRFGLARGVVTARYKVIYDLVEEWIREVPWLDQFVYKGKGRGNNARSKVPKRTIVARGLQDVVQFQEEIWAKKMNAQGRPSVVIEADPGETEGKEDVDEDDRGSSETFSTASKTTESYDTPSGPPRKKRKTKREVLDDASQFLLNPLTSTLPAIASPSFCHVPPSRTFTLPPPETSDSDRLSTAHISLTSYLLSCSASALTRRDVPTRLQLLAADRGGSTEEHIDDEELFGEGELEGIFRSEQEREALEPLFMMEWGESGGRRSGEVGNHAEESKSAKGKEKEVSRGSGRVDMEALARVLGGEDLSGDDKSDAEEVDEEQYFHQLATPPRDAHTMDGVEEVEEWRPLSPENAFGRGYGGMDRYDEEY
ncbi:hypothetical protein BV22DRAFT_1016542 [Leucogyrophana mollusca]|uniref:Uncharacterized protein n=1 Tax=Leucogyrophana mollusca TaxID=85980 RepID=A0ACB8BAK8_9AGAM|nr:hypothetical protein BV22DRAFT_1016542 [Leucogyrophana mollusca]